MDCGVSESGLPPPLPPVPMMHIVPKIKIMMIPNMVINFTNGFIRKLHYSLFKLSTYRELSFGQPTVINGSLSIEFIKILPITVE